MGTEGMAGESGSTPQIVSEETIRQKLEELPGWRLQDGALHCALTFRDFTEAFSFMTAAALVSEQLGHHPEWSNTYNRLSITLFTHDLGGITEKDLAWVERVFPFHRAAVSNSAK